MPGIIGKFAFVNIALERLFEKGATRVLGSEAICSSINSMGIIVVCLEATICNGVKEPAGFN